MDIINIEKIPFFQTFFLKKSQNFLKPYQPNCENLRLNIFRNLITKNLHIKEQPAIYQCSNWYESLIKRLKPIESLLN